MVCMVVTAIIVSISSILLFEELVSSPAFLELLETDYVGSSDATQIFSSLQWLDNTLLFSAIGGIATSILLFFSLYVPYKRITSGELRTVLPSHLKRCSNCGRVLRSDYAMCPYCAKKFESYI